VLGEESDWVHVQERLLARQKTNRAGHEILPGVEWGMRVFP